MQYAIAYPWPNVIEKQNVENISWIENCRKLSLEENVRKHLMNRELHQVLLTHSPTENISVLVKFMS